MNTSKQQFVGLVLLGAVLLGGGYLFVDRVYLKPKAELESQLATAQRHVETFRATLDRRPRIDRDVSDIIDRTLGGEVQSVDHNLRSRLNRIADAVGLSHATVTTSSPSPQRTPAQRMFRDPELRAELDFVEVDGAIAAEGTLEQVIELIDRIEHEPWIKRIGQVRLDPRDNGQRVNATVRLTTLFVPGRAPEALAEASYHPQRMARFDSLLQTNPFRVPPPQQPVPRRVVAEEPSTTPWEHWIVTGLADGRDGEEAWLRNQSTGESRRLTAGQALDEVRFIAVNGDRAVFEQEDDRFLVAIGSKLNDRMPLNE